MLLFYFTVNSGRANSWCKFCEGENNTIAKIISIDSRSECTIELIEVLTTNKHLKKGDRLDVYYHVWSSQTIQVGDKGMFKLSMKNQNWHVDFAQYPDAGDQCTIENDYFYTQVDLHELLVGTHYFNEAVNFKPKPPSSYWRDTAYVVISDSLLNQYLSENAYFRYIFYCLDFFNQIDPKPNHGFWQMFANQHARIIEQEETKGNVRFVSGEPNSRNADYPSFYLHFLNLNSDRLIESEYVLEYDSKTDTARLKFEITYQTPQKQAATLDLKNELGYAEKSRFDFVVPGYNQRHYFDSYFIAANHQATADFRYITKNEDTITGGFKNGELDGRICTKQRGLIYQMSFSQGVKHGLWEVRNEQTNQVLFHCTYQLGYRYGAYFSCNEDGNVLIEGTYDRGEKVGEWKEYYGATKRAYAIENFGSLIQQKTLGINELIEEEGPALELLSYYGIDQADIGKLFGVATYFRYSGNPVSKQNWNRSELLSREDWYYVGLGDNDSTLFQLDPLIVPDTVKDGSRLTLVYHTEGTYRNNKPWNGTFLIGGFTGFRGSASGRQPPIKVEVAKYENGVCMQTVLIYENASSRQFYKPDERKKKKKWRLFKRRNK